MRRLEFMMAATVILYATAGSGLAASKAQKTLNQIKQVDGAGSGLDADTLRGMTPDQLTAKAEADALSKIISAASLTTTQTSVASGFCSCVETGCDTSPALIGNCGATIVPFNSAASLTESSLVSGGAPNVGHCEACACNDGGVPITLVGTALCIAL